MTQGCLARDVMLVAICASRWLRVDRAAARLSHHADMGRLFGRPQELAQQYSAQERDDRERGVLDQGQEAPGRSVGDEGPSGGFSEETRRPWQ
jgi:hypothetical protein